MAVGTAAFKVAILQNVLSTHAGADAINASLRQHVLKSCPTAEMAIFKPIDGEPFPDLECFDLVILTGGVYNLLVAETKPKWVEETLNFIRETAQGAGPKLLGLCWGHQAINYALGGSLDTLPQPRIGVETLRLAQEGNKFFDGSESLGDTINIHKFHKRWVSQAADGFIPLATDNEILMSPSKRMLSFQGHPELSFEISGTLLAGDDGSYVKSGNGDKGDLKSIDAAHDGTELFKSIMGWALARGA